MKLYYRMSDPRAPPAPMVRLYGRLRVPACLVELVSDSSCQHVHLGILTFSVV